MCFPEQEQARDSGTAHSFPLQLLSQEVRLIPLGCTTCFAKEGKGT